jgi:hypothetical protein
MRLLCLLLCLLALIPAFAGVSLLQKDGDAYTNPTPPPPYAQLLADNGFNLGFPTTEMRSVGKLTPELMRQYNVVVLPTLMGWSTDQKPEELGRYLDDYLRSGGGVMLFQLTYLEGIPLFEALNTWLKPYGASFRWEELEDDAHKYADPPAVPWQAPHFFWTDNVAASPLTRDVKQVFWVPGAFRGPHLAGLNVDKNWQVLLSAPATTKQYKLTYSKADFYVKRTEDVPTTGAVPLLAVRQVGKGRLAVFGGSPATFWFDLGKPVYGRVPQERGDGVRKSDWMPLLYNVLRWLAEPAQKAGKPGGYNSQVQFSVRPDYGNRTPIDWEKVDREGVSPELVQQTLTWHGGVTAQDWKDWETGKYKPYKVLLAAKTSLSGGKGSVADWKKAALAAGYSAVVFREDIYNLTPEQWTAFRKECDAASDATFRAVVGQEYEDWIGNKFMHFQGDLIYPPHLAERSTNNKMRDQLSFFCDEGWPVRLPLSVKHNPTEFWNYRLTYGWPMYIYDAGGKLTEDNRREWEELVDSYEYPTGVAVHLLDDPAQIPQAATGAQTYVLATSLPDFNGRSAGDLFGCSNNPRVFTTTGPMIDNFHCLNMFRTTLGSRDVAGSYRYKTWIKAHSDKPIARVELWGGDEPVRVYRPMTKEFSAVVDELHDRQRGLWLKVVDVDGGEARATGIMVHDKMLEFVWCGDLENALPYGLGTDDAGNVFTIGIGTRVKSSFQGIDGPGTDGYDMWRYVPWGTDTSAPAVGLLGDVRLWTNEEKTLPDAKEWYTSRVSMPYGSREVMDERLTATRLVNWQDYVPKYQPAINGWYPFTQDHDTTAFDLVHDDVEFHRSAGVPALQWSHGAMTFKQDVTLSSTQPLNVLLARFNNNMPLPYAYTSAGEVPLGDHVIKLGKGGFLTWPGQMGHVTVFGLDDDFAVRVNNTGKRVYLDLGYNFPGRQFKTGEKFTYQLVTMRWPSGMPLSDRLDVRVAAALNLADREPAYTVAAKRGTVVGTQLFLDLQADKGVFTGSFSRAWLGTRVPARLWGLNHRWTACVWRKGAADQILAPLCPRADDQAAYFSLDLENEAGDLFLGSVVTCDQPEVWIRVLQRSDAGFDVVAHNPGEQAVTVNLQGEPGGPLEGFKQTVQLAPGAEQRLKGK